MKYNAGGFIPPEKKAKKITIISVSLFTGIVILVIIALILLSAFKIIYFEMEAIVAIIAVLISLSTILFTFLDRLYIRYFSTKKIINLSIDVLENSVICWGEIGNQGHKRILNKNVYLVVSKGELKDGQYKFGLSLEHEDDDGNISCSEDFCIYSKIMHICSVEKCSKCVKNLDTLDINNTLDNRSKKIMTRFNMQITESQTYHRIFVFKGLSKESRLFVDAGEEFSDELVIELSHGMYRAVMIWIPEGDEDCACSVKYFQVN